MKETTDTELKRIFIGNLPSQVTEVEIEEKFNKFGRVQSVDLKQRKDNDGCALSTFAFLNLVIDQDNLASCFNSVANRKWKGHQLKLELAKESFLSRLQKEREERSSRLGKASFTESGSLEGQEHGERKRRDNVRPTVGGRKVKVDDVNNSHLLLNRDSESDGVKKKGNLPMFVGTKLAQRKVRNRMCNNTNAGDLNHCTDKFEVRKAEEHMLKRFEMFSDVWKDSLPPHLHQPEFDTRFEVVPQTENLEPISKVSENNCSKRNSHESPIIEVDHERFSNENTVAVSEAKRLKSMAEKRQFLRQKQATIKSALATVDFSKSSNNKKIVFDSDNESKELEDRSGKGQITFNRIKSKQREAESESCMKKLLFEENSSEDDVNQEEDFRVKTQFEGTKGQKLLELQSRYGTDKRFTLDERFLESDEETERPTDIKSNTIEDEKKMQLNILKSILGQDLISIPGERRNNFRTTSMLRFDPTKSDHSKYEIKPEVPSTTCEGNGKESTTPKNKEKKIVETREEVETEHVSTATQERFYNVSDSLNDALIKKPETFSFLKMFSSDHKASATEDTYQATVLEKQSNEWVKNPFKYDSSDTEDEAVVITEGDASEAVVSIKKMWTESFFFKPDDIRLQEGQQFFNRKENLDEMRKSFVEQRKELKQIVRTKVRNSKQKNRFQRVKLGGSFHKGRKFKKR